MFLSLYKLKLHLMLEAVNKKYHLGFTLLLMLFLFPNSSVAQCCSAGNPFFYGEQASLAKKELQFLLGYKYSTSTKYYEGSNPISIDFVDKAFFNYFNFQAQYGITYRLSVQADIGYFINKTEYYSLEGWNDQKGYGVGDLMLTIRYLAYTNYAKKFSITPSIGIKFPIGVFDQEVDNVKLPITLQPSSGSFKYSLNLYINKGFKNPKWNLGMFGSYEYAQLIDSKNFYYKYGNMFMLSVLGSYRLGSKINAGLELRNEYRGKSKRDNDQVVESSGYNILYTIPHISYSISPNWMIAANAEFPIYRYYNGIQMGNTYAVSVRLSYKIDFVK